MLCHTGLPTKTFKIVDNILSYSADVQDLVASQNSKIFSPENAIQRQEMSILL